MEGNNFSTHFNSGSPCPRVLYTRMCVNDRRKQFPKNHLTTGKTGPNYTGTMDRDLSGFPGS